MKVTLDQLTGYLAMWAVRQSQTPPANLQAALAAFRSAAPFRDLFEVPHEEALFIFVRTAIESTPEIAAWGDVDLTVLARNIATGAALEASATDPADLSTKDNDFAVSLGHDVAGRVLVKFNRPLDMMVLSAEQATAIANGMLEHAGAT